MKKSIIYTLIISLALVACQKDPDVILTTVNVSNEVLNPSYTTAIVQCNISCSNSTAAMSILCSTSADMANAQEVVMKKEGGHYEATLTGLQDETTYYVRYKASNKLSSLMAKQMSEFKTLTPSVPEVRLVSITNVLDSSAMAEISLITDGGAEVSQYGICWSTGETPTKDDAHCETQQLQLSYSLSSLQPNTKYYVRAYAVNKKGIAYSEAKSLLTYALPCVETKAITNIQKTGCQLNGEVTFNGNDANYVEGFCWSTKSQPTISDNCTTMAETDATFSYNLTNLKAETTYYVRAFAKNKIGLVYGNELTFTTKTADKPTVTTSSVTNIFYTSATCGGNVTDDGGASVTERGVCYATTSNPTTSNTKVTSGTGTGSFSCNLTGLTDGTTYYIRTYAVNSKGTSYGEEKSFTTMVYSAPTITTSSVTNISYTSATCGGNVTADGGLNITERGICYATTLNPTISDTKVTSGTGTGSFSCNLTGLTDGTTYYVRAYATNSKGTSYGAVKTITTSTYTTPIVVTMDVSNILYISATCSGKVTSDGGLALEERGICFSNTNTIPTINDARGITDLGIGEYSCTLNNILTQGTTYYYRAYARNEKGAGYGEVKSFTTKGTTKPTIVTSNVTDVSYTTATCGGNVYDDGGEFVVERGVCFATTINPTTSNDKVINGGGKGVFVCNITNLADGTTYYVRAYATNSRGTSYGEEKIFTTTAYSKPTITTSDATNISYTSAACGGNVTSDGGQSVTERGICYSTSSNPTTSSTKIISGSGTGSFSCSITGLEESTTYYVRAYAINSKGTRYGETISFMTLGKIGVASVLSSSGRTSCNYVQLWENGPKWATFNVGSTITDYANLTIGADPISYKSSTDLASYYNTANVGGLYPWYTPNLNGRITTWSTSISSSNNDVATTLWGSNWKTPTYNQLSSLKNNTTWTWCDGSSTQYVAGCTLKGYKVSGKGEYAKYSIFLPAAGNSDGTGIYNAGNQGSLWSGQADGSYYAYTLNISQNWGNCFMDTKRRYYGYSVRAVLVE